MKLKNLLFIALTSLVLAGCMFTEELYLNRDGSGKYAFKMDMGQMMESMKGTAENDSVYEPQKLDTIVYFKDILKTYKDSIAKLEPGKRQALEALKNFQMNMHIDEANDEMNMIFSTNFKNVSELKDMEDKISKMQAMSDKKADKEPPVESKSSVSYAYSGNIFKRNVTIKDLAPEVLKQIDSANQQTSMFLNGSTYKIIYHFESPIQEVNYKDAVISADKKTLTIEVPMDSLVKNPQLLNFEVKLK